MNFGMNYLLVILGTGFMIYRFWISHYHLKDLLDYERFFTSRILVLYAAIACIFNYSTIIFNLIIIAAYPMMVFCFFYWDVPFLLKIIQEKPILPETIVIQKSSLKLWLILERFTVHLPIIIIGTPWYLHGIKGNIIPQISVQDYIIAMLLVVIPFLFIDPRITKKKLWPEGLWLSLVFLVSAIGFYLHFFVIFIL